MLALLLQNFARISLGIGLLAGLSWLYFSTTAQSVEPVKAKVGLVELPCWFTPQPDWPQTHCYRMYVPENHQQNDRLISFPIIQFKSFAGESRQPPLMHLGAGGPGAAMWLQNQLMVEFTWQGFEHSVLRQGRDLLLMDPRGTGMAQPRLACPSIVSYGLQQLNQRQLTAEQRVVEHQILRECIATLQQQGIDVAQYNSKSVVEDLKLLRHAFQLEQWSLFGVSYGAVYALLYTNEAAEHVETLILDSPAFPALKNVENPAARFMATFQQLENYCQFDDACTEPLPRFPERLWQLAERLDQQPLTVSIPSGFFGMNIPVQLSGEMLLHLLAWAAYDNAIYSELPQIIIALEQGNVSPFYEYVDNYVSYIKDNEFSVVSMASHLCFDEVPFIDYAKLQQSFSELPKGFLRDAGLYAYQWPASLCPVFGPVNSGNEMMVKQTLTSIPTLFLHGLLDTVTPLDDVKQQMPFFSRSQLRVYPLSHGVHGRLDCVDQDLAVFLNAPRQIANPAACQLN